MFVQNVDSVYKTIHRPTVAIQILHIDQVGPENLEGAALNAIFFAMYAAAIITVPEEDRATFLSPNHEESLQHFVSTTEYLLARADYLNSKDVRCLQAFIIYIVCCH